MFGTPEQPITRPGVTIIAQHNDCSAFLLLAKDKIDYLDLEEHDDLPEGFIFTYCQEWGINLSRDKITRTLKDLRAKAVAAIKVTTQSGKTFDGDEVSQGRMARAVLGMQAAGVPTIRWTLADNTQADVTVEELMEALVLAGAQQAALWPIPDKWR